MELIEKYMEIFRKDPTVMSKTIARTINDIERLVQAYSGSIQISHRLMMDMKEMISGYLMKQNLSDLFSVILYWGGEKLVCAITYVYNDKRMVMKKPGVFHKWD